MKHATDYEALGYRARERGEPLTANPYNPTAYSAHPAWERGWKKADEELSAIAKAEDAGNNA